jgi:hypothetical protein
VNTQRNPAAVCLAWGSFWSALANLASWRKPTISPISNTGVYPNATSRPIAFVIGDAQMPPAALTVTGTSADTNLRAE